MRNLTAYFHRPFLFTAAVGLIVNLLPASGVQAQIFGEAARTEFFGGWGLRTFYSRISKTDLLREGNKIRSTEQPEVFINIVPFAVVYGALPKLSLLAVVPTISRSAENTVDGRRVSHSDFGLGDITLLAKYRFYKKNDFLRTRELALQAGLKLPTSADDLRDGQRVRLPQPLQLGTGSFDPKLAFIFTEARNRLIFSGDLAYTMTTEANDFEFGDLLNYDFAVKFRFHPARFSDDGPPKQHFAFIEFNGVVRRHATAGGVEIEDSGGHQIFIAPGVQLFLLQNFLFEAGLQIPVLQDLNGTQLGTDFNLRSGVRWIL